MKRLATKVLSAILSGLIIVLPIYLSILLLAKIMRSVVGLVRPLAKLLPAWLPAEHILSFLLVVVGCFLIGVIVRTQAGSALRDRMDRFFSQKLPGYTLCRSLTQQLAGTSDEHVWKPALAEIEESLVPAFIIEEFEDGRSTVFVPAAPTPFTGAIYILTPERVHPVDIPFTKAIRSLARWGSGSKELVAAMKTEPSFARIKEPPAA